MAKPTHPTIVSMYGRELDNLVNESTELWEVKMQLLVPKGVDVEQKIADVCTGNWKNNEPISMSYTDISRVK